MKIAVLIACHNRREKTLQCLRLLHGSADEFIRKERKNIEVHVFLVDDGSTDWTSEAVKGWSDSILHHSSPVTLHLIRGNGSLFWARGMALAWREALRYERSTNPPTSSLGFDYFLWLNDDVELYPDALSLLCLAMLYDYIVLVGKTESAANSAIKTYGVVERWFNGNFVLVPRKVYEKVGIISDEYTHARADYDYAERVRRAGIEIVETEHYVGTCPDDFNEKYCGKTLPERLTLLWLPGYWNLHDLWLFQSKYYGGLRAILCCTKLIVIALRGVRP